MMNKTDSIVIKTIVILLALSITFFIDSILAQQDYNSSAVLGTGYGIVRVPLMIFLFAIILLILATIEHKLFDKNRK